MDEFLLVMIDRLSTQKKHSRQAAIASSQTYSCSDRFSRSGHETSHGPPVKADSELAYVFYQVEV